jgi:hypothetical protein
MALAEQCDLHGIVAERLRIPGVTAPENRPICTVDPDSRQ